SRDTHLARHTDSTHAHVAVVGGCSTEQPIKSVAQFPSFGTHVAAAWQGLLRMTQSASVAQEGQLPPSVAGWPTHGLESVCGASAHAGNDNSNTRSRISVSPLSPALSPLRKEREKVTSVAASAAHPAARRPTGCRT